MKSLDIIVAAGHLLRDVAHARWTVEKLLLYIGDGLLKIAEIRPDLCAQRQTLTLVAGPSQTIPTDTLRLMEVSHNVVTGTDGSERQGRAITVVDREAMDAASPLWRAAKQSRTIYQYMQEARDPRAFLVYPPAVAGAKVSALLSVAPARPTDENGTDDLDIVESMKDALTAYVAYRCYAEEGEFASRAGEFAALFTNMVSGDRSATIAFGVNANADGGKVSEGVIKIGGV